MAVRTLPDAELLVTGYLRAHTDVAALVGTRVSTELPPEPVFPCVTLTRVGGVPSLPNYLDGPRIEIVCWGVTKGSAHLVARTVEGAMLQIPGTHPLGTVTGVVGDGLGLRWAPDEPDAQPRYRLLFELYIHG